MEGLLNKVEVLHKQDPVIEEVNGTKMARELLYSQRMVEKLQDLVPQAEKEIVVAAMCHHLCRWEVDRKSFPEGKVGYHMWRKEVYNHQANKAKGLMVEENLSDEFQDKVIRIIKKEGIKKHADVQLIEDIACIVFVEHYIEPFSKKYSDEKLLGILRKTLAKMSEQGHQWLLESKIPDKIVQLVEKLNL